MSSTITNRQQQSLPVKQPQPQPQPVPQQTYSRDADASYGKNVYGQGNTAMAKAVQQYAAANGKPVSAPPAQPQPQPNGINASVASAKQVDLAHMTQDQQYDYIKNMTIQKAGGDKSAWNDGNYELNIVGVRGMGPAGYGDSRGGLYNDTILVARMVDGKKEVYPFNASVDGGVLSDAGKALAAEKGLGGSVHMVEGYYRDAFTKGNVNGDELGLRQTRGVHGNIDLNNDGRITGDEILNGGAGQVIDPELQLQFHRGNDKTVGDSSLGCQVINPDQYNTFQVLLNQAPASQTRFSYLLVDNNAAANAPTMNTYHTDNGGRGSKGGIGIIRTPGQMVASRGKTTVQPIASNPYFAQNWWQNENSR